MRVGTELSLLVAVGVLAAGCGAGSNASGDSDGLGTPGTVGGVGQLGNTLPNGLETATSAVTGPGTSSTSSSTSVELADPRPIEEYVIDSGNGQRIDDPRVLMIGDSVLEATTFRNPDDLDRYVATLGWRIWVDAQRGRRMGQGLATLQELVAGESPWDTGWAWAAAPDGRGPVIPEVVVLMLGNNFEGDEAEFVSSLDGILDLLDGARKVVLFTVPLYQPEQAEVNAALRAAATRDDRIVLVDWERMSREWEGTLKTDGLHPTENKGGHYLAQLIARVLGPAPEVPALVDLPVIGELTTDDPLPDWTPPKARETVAEVP